MKTLEQILEEMPKERRSKVEARAARLIAEQVTLRELRKAHPKTQVQLARKLHMTQGQVSRLEQRSDLLLFTLRKFVEGMGGRLSLIAEFPAQMPVRLTGFSELEEGVASASHPARRRSVAKRPIKRNRNKNVA